MQNQKTFYTLLAALLLSTGQKALAEGLSVKAVRQINPTTVELTYDNGEMLTVDFYGKNVFRKELGDEDGEAYIQYKDSKLTFKSPEGSTTLGSILQRLRNLEARL